MLGRRAMRPPEFQEGCVIPGTDYRVTAYVGSGMSGCVYEVVHRELRRPFVLKAFDATCMQGGEIPSSLRSQWRALGQLAHPSFVAVTDAGTTAAGVPFFVMERLAGETLAQRMQRAPRLRPVEALDIAMSLLSGLDAAHRIGVVHGRIKPSNVFLAGDQVKILDCGLASVLASERPRAVVSPTGPDGRPYEAPELVTGGRMDARTDLFSVGVLLFEMLTGQRPFGASVGAGEGRGSQGVGPAARRLTTFMPDASHALETVLARLLEREPRSRPESAYLVHEALMALAEPYRRGRRRSGHPLAAGLDASATDRLLAALEPGEPTEEARFDMASAELASTAIAPAVGGSADRVVEADFGQTIVEAPPTDVQSSGKAAREPPESTGRVPASFDPLLATRITGAPWSSASLDDASPDSAHDPTVPLSLQGVEVPGSIAEPRPTRTAVFARGPEGALPRPSRFRSSGSALASKPRPFAQWLLVFGLLTILVVIVAIAWLSHARRGPVGSSETEERPLPPTGPAAGR